MKDLLTDEKIDNLVSRLRMLNTTLKPSWGSLTVTGMLYHCNLITNLILSSNKTRKPTIKERLLRPVFYTLKKLPKNFKSGDQFIATNPQTLNFEEEKDKFIQTLLQLKNYRKIQGIHPLFGPFDTNEWRKFLLLHTLHHLKQFNA